MSDHEFRLLADHAPVLIWRAGTDGRCDYFNQPWLDFRGRRLEEELGDGWLEGVHPEDRERCFSAYREAFDRRAPFKIAYRLRRHDGVYRWVEDSGRSFQREGVFAGYIGSCADVTEQRDTEQKLANALAERELLLREVHHRVKNNFQTLMALTRFMRRDAGPEAKKPLELLEMRVAVMALVQRHLHDADDLSTLSVADMVEKLLPELADMEAAPKVEPSLRAHDFVLPAKTCSYLGLAICESAILLGSKGAAAIAIAVEGTDEGPAVVIAGRGLRAGLLENHPGLRLAMQYARGAGADLALAAIEGQSAIRVSLPAGAS